MEPLEDYWQDESLLELAAPLKPFVAQRPPQAQQHRTPYKAHVLRLKYHHHADPKLVWRVQDKCLAMSEPQYLSPFDFIYVDVTLPPSEIHESWRRNFERFLLAGVRLPSTIKQNKSGKGSAPDELYFFAGCTSSQQRQGKSCYLVRADSPDAVQKQTLAPWRLFALNILAKRLKHAGILFSTCPYWFDLTGVSINIQRDVERNAYNFTDGCGTISEELMREISAVCVGKGKKGTRLKDYPCASVIQIRARMYHQIRGA